MQGAIFHWKFVMKLFLLKINVKINSLMVTQPASARVIQSKYRIMKH